MRLFLIILFITYSLFFRGLDFAPVDSSIVREDMPIVVVLHGLSGGAQQLCS